MKASVIIPVWNGMEYLRDCLDALLAQDYPDFEVIAVDNASTDGSVEFVAKNYPMVRVIRNERNLGFAGGCNIGIQASRGKYVILLNNDAVPHPGWLKNLVTVAESDPQAGMVTSRIQLFYDQLPLSLKVTPYKPESDDRTLGIQIFKVESNVDRGVVQYLEGFYGWENTSPVQRFRWTKEEALLGIPVPRSNQNWSVSITMAAPRPHNQPIHLSISVEDHMIAKQVLQGSSPKKHRIEIPAHTRTWATPLIQNAGSLILWDGSGRDRGTFVRDSEVFYEEDQGQYGTVEEVAAGCGAGLLIRREMLEDVGLLDDDFFMYYEDTDLSLRARWRGWKILYAPKAVLRHIHCGFSKEWSPFFVYHTDRNRLAMLFKNGLPEQVWEAWRSYLVTALGQLLRAGVDGVNSRTIKRNHARRAWIHWRVIGTLLLWLPKLWQKRKQIQREATVSPSAIASWFKK